MEKDSETAKEGAALASSAAVVPDSARARRAGEGDVPGREATSMEEDDALSIGDERDARGQSPKTHPSMRDAWLTLYSTGERTPLEGGARLVGINAKPSMADERGGVEERTAASMRSSAPLTEPTVDMSMIEPFEGGMAPGKTASSFEREGIGPTISTALIDSGGQSLGGASLGGGSEKSDASLKGPVGLDREPAEEQDDVSLQGTRGFRYQTLTTLGTGGFGVVVEAYDQHLRRRVALKMARDDHGRARSEWRRRAEAALVFEARLAGRIEDPRVVPIHDLGRTPDGRIYLAMKLVRGTSLAAILERMASGDETVLGEYTLIRRLSIFVQLCFGVAYVHDQGIIHRDLKPANIMVGEYGEIQIIDWGLARFLPSADQPPPLPDVLHDRDRQVIQGTPGYMAPEQAVGDFEAIDARSDIYALGAILYEMLTFRPPIEEENADIPLTEQLMRIALGRFKPPSKRVPGLFVPEDLEAICLKAMAVEQDKRFQSARELACEVETYLEGTRLKSKARQLALTGSKLSEEYRSLQGALDEARRAVQSAAARIPRWAPPEEKKLLWALEDNVTEIEQRKTVTFSEAVRTFHEALGYDRESALARAGLADIYWTRFEEAERNRQIGAAAFFERMVRQYDTGILAKKLKGDGRLRLTSSQDGIECWLFTYQEIERRLVARDGRRIGRTPLVIDPLPMGRYLVVARDGLGRDFRIPLVIDRLADVRFHLWIPPRLPGEEWVFVPAGPARVGGDPLAPGSLDEAIVDVLDFAIKRFPTTCAEYCEFLNQLSEEEAAHRVPRTGEENSTVAVWWRDEGGRYFVPRRDRFGTRWDGAMPITSISWDDAQAYTRWLGRRLRAPVRLPRDAEWEKAARGIDGRFFPWGNHFDPSFCKMAESRPGQPQPEVIGTCPADESPYGVRDMAGGMPDWVDGYFDDQNLLMTIRGGGWFSSEERCRVAGRSGGAPRVPNPNVSFRPLLDLHSLRGDSAGRPDAFPP